MSRRATVPRLALGPVHSVVVTPPENLGVRLYVEDVQERLGRYPVGHVRAGQFRFSKWWCLHNVAPDSKFMLGRTACWYEADVDAWLARQGQRRGQGR